MSARLLRAAHVLAAVALLSAAGALARALAPAAGLAAARAGAPAACPEARAGALRLLRLHGARARLSWGAPAGSPAGTVYLVRRNGRTVGQTTRSSIVLRIVPGRMTSYLVQARASGRAGACALTLRTALPFHTPGRVASLRVLHYTGDGVLLAWRSARPGDAPIAGYRVQRDGAVVGQTRHTKFVVRLGRGRTHSVLVQASDTRGHLGPLSNTVLVTLGSRAARTLPPSPPPPPLPPASVHGAPQPPTQFAAERVTDTSATLAWNAGVANGAPLTGYELFKDSKLVGVIHGQSTTVTLASARTYIFTVAAIDSTGALSAPSPSLTVVTTHTPPSTPVGVAASAVTSTSATLAWSPSAPVSGTIAGYRVFRDGVPLGQSASPEMLVAGLAPSTAYRFTVVAVDSLGAISAPSSPTAIQTLPPPPTHGDVQAFLLASTDQSFHDLEAHYEQVGVVYPTYFDCGPGGAVGGGDDPLITGWAEARKIAVMPRVNCQNVAYEEQILNSPQAREAFIEHLAALCSANGYAGVQIDFEGAPPAERNPFTAFITLLAERLHGQGEKLSTIVTAKYYNVPTGRAAMYDDAALSGPSDYLFVLDWGLHWTTSGPGSIDEYGWFKRVAEYTATLPNPSKFVIGMPMYGIDWANGGGSSHPGKALEFSAITSLAEGLGVEPGWDSLALSPHFVYTDGEGAHHDVWYTDSQSIEARAQLARSLGLGVGLWRLGEEDQSVWALPQLGGGS